MNGEAVTEQQDVCTHEQVLDLIVEKGPVTATVIAKILGLTTAAVHRHITIFLNSGQIVEHEPGVIGKRGRGRPVHHYVATENTHTSLLEGYSELALKALGYLGQIGGGEAVEGLAAARSHEIERRYAPIVRVAGSDPRVRVLTPVDAPTQDGYAATIRDIGDGQIAMQLCQGRYPIQQVASDSPALCEAEAKAFARLLDVHVRGLATLVGRDHVCTTHILVRTPVIHPTARAALRR